MEENKSAAEETEEISEDLIEVIDAEEEASRFEEEKKPETPASKEKKPHKHSFVRGVILGVIVGLVVALAAGVAGTGTQTLLSYTSSELSYEDKVDLIMAYLEAYYIGEIDEEALEDGILSGMLSGLDDDYAAYYTAEEMEELLEENSGEYAGIGISITMNDDGYPVVYKVFDGTPAQEAGIQVNDIIIEAAGVSDFESLDDVVAVVRGEAGTTVDITIERDGEEIELTVERQNIEVETVTYEMLEGNIGYIYISEFDTITESQFEDAVDELVQEGAVGIIFDLRDNPGGQLDTVVAMADYILPEGTIVTVESADGDVDVYTSDDKNSLDLPMVCIINGNSASASEVFVGALKDFGVACVVGETSFGKGIVQSLWQLSDGSGIKFTTAVYYTPSGTSLHGVGITPDIEVSLPEDAYDDGVLDEDEDTQLQAAIEALTEQ